MPGLGHKYNLTTTVFEDNTGDISWSVSEKTPKHVDLCLFHDVELFQAVTI